MLLTGSYEVKIDAKHRLAIPAKLRDRFSGSDSTLFATLGEAFTIWLYTRAAFEKRIEDLAYSDKPQTEVLAYERMMMSFTHEVDLDAQGRIRLPEQLLNKVALEKEVVVIGNVDHLEIHDRASWQAQEDETMAMLKARPEMLMNPRRLARPPRSDAGN